MLGFGDYIYLSRRTNDNGELIIITFLLEKKKKEFEGAAGPTTKYQVQGLLIINIWEKGEVWNGKLL